MNIDLSEENKLIRQLAKSFAEKEILPKIKEYEQKRRFPRDIIRKMGEQGFYGACFPEKYGGSELGFLNLAIIAEEISRVSASIGSTFNAQSMTVPFTILNWGTEAQIEKYVPKLIGGEWIGFFGLTEPGGGSDAAGSMKTRAILDGNEYVVNGQKVFASYASVADVGLLFAKTDPDAGHKGISAFIIQMDRPGIEAKDISMSSLGNLTKTCELFLTDYRIPKENLLGNEGEGFKIAMNALDYGRLTIPARSVGLAQACLEAAIQYCNERVVGGHKIGEYQMIQRLIADMTVEIEAARLLTYKSAYLKDKGAATTRESSHSKYFAAEVVWRAAQAVYEIYGGYALADEYPINQYLAYAGLFRTGEGSANIQRILIAEDALGWKDANRHNMKRRFSLKSDIF
ncbi:acyl-CoA dehydrogenase family protein [Aneurinibacillus sp. UBA3580]|uniref:acyl-CoA dehydrogenase family protein n=1 Tax=Aneurinibacillus sp. UBA3580 TaxID=1946041 RepID=UPI00257F60DC|nr:acyl-CoA dehydrogenase family protein [Aneurinibacillus sp. UBA3580]